MSIDIEEFSNVITILLIFTTLLKLQLRSGEQILSWQSNPEKVQKLLGQELSNHICPI